MLVPLRTAFLLAAGLAACDSRPAPDYLVLATTTSVANSGLLDMLLPEWRRAGGPEVRPTLVGSGRALRMLADGQADLAISHAPAAEAEMLRAPARSWRYRKIMFNYFVLVGPPEDPAAVRAEATLEAALRRVAGSGAFFVSRGDQSGTHEREQALWSLAGVSPGPDALLTSGAGMAVTLRQASDRGAYTLTDRATFEQLKPRLALETVFAGDPRLINTYSVIVDRRGARREGALRFADWLASGRGRELTAAYRIAGSDVQPFEVWPEGVGGDGPEAVPDP